jgi:hypothetical protein
MTSRAVDDGVVRVVAVDGRHWHRGLPDELAVAVNGTGWCRFSVLGVGIAAWIALLVVDDVQMSGLLRANRKIYINGRWGLTHRAVRAYDRAWHGIEIERVMSVSSIAYLSTSLSSSLSWCSVQLCWLYFVFLFYVAMVYIILCSFANTYSCLNEGLRL